LLLRQGKFDQSIDYYDQVLQIDSTFDFAYKGLGDNYVFKGAYNLARKYYRMYKEKASSDRVKLYAILMEASVHLHEKNIPGAIRVMDRYVNQAKDMGLPLYQISGMGYKSYILTETGNYRQAIKKIDDSWKSNPRIWYYKAMALVRNKALSALEE